MQDWDSKWRGHRLLPEDMTESRWQGNRTEDKRLHRRLPRTETVHRPHRPHRPHRSHRHWQAAAVHHPHRVPLPVLSLHPPRSYSVNRSYLPSAEQQPLYLKCPPQQIPRSAVSLDAAVRPQSTPPPAPLSSRWRSTGRHQPHAAICKLTHERIAVGTCSILRVVILPP